MHQAFLCPSYAIRTHHWPLGLVFSKILVWLRSDLSDRQDQRSTRDGLPRKSHSSPKHSLVIAFESEETTTMTTTTTPIWLLPKNATNHSVFMARNGLDSWTETSCLPSVTVSSPSLASSPDPLAFFTLVSYHSRSSRGRRSLGSRGGRSSVLNSSYPDCMRRI